LVGALVARDLDPFLATASAAFVHGMAAAGTGLSEGMVAGDLLENIARYLSSGTIGA
jgi:NAD(P)H-hydrate repair Nnr-like enzyme with NAD(P)H-hydrate dehydratase domain